MTRAASRTRNRLCIGLLSAAVLGVVSTYAIAAGAVFFGRRAGVSLSVAANTLFNASGREYWAQRFAGGGFERIDITPFRGSSPLKHESAPMLEALASTVDLIDLDALGPNTGNAVNRPGLTVQFHRAGWPWPTVQAVTAHTWTGTTPRVACIVGGWPIFGEPALIATGFQPAILPIKPLWREFLAASGVMASAWALFASVGPLLAVRWWRQRNSRCIECGYPWSSNHPKSVCSECGAAAPPLSGEILIETGRSVNR